MSDAIAIFARAPIPGRVKTRLAQTIGNEAAAELYGAMLRDTLDLARKAARTWTNCEVVLAYTPVDAFAKGQYSLAPFWSGPRLSQCEGDLGERLLDCAVRFQEQGAERVVIIGSDSPDLAVSWICHAFSILNRKELHFESGAPCMDHADLVFGPARDGGFYLLGAAGKIPRELFDGVAWSGRSTLSQVEANAQRLQLSVKAVPEWDDVDTLHDLHRLAQRLGRDTRPAPTHAPHTARWLRANNLLEDI